MTSHRARVPMVRHGASLALIFSFAGALAQGITKAMLERQYAVTCTPQNQRVNPALVYQCQQWRSQIDAMDETGDTTDAEAAMPVPPNDPATPAPPRKQSAPPVNQCISVRTTWWGSRQFFNGCDFTVNITWCVEDPDSAFACKGGKIDGQGLNFIAPNTEQAVGGKGGQVHFVACRGGAAGGLYATMKDGRAECK
jgi:hypothetical protein